MVGKCLRVGLLIRALTVGGAERQLVNVARGLRRAGHDVHVLVFYRAGTFLEAELAESGVPVVDLEKRNRWDVLGFLGRLRSAARDLQLDVVYSFLPTANVVAAVIWGGPKHPAVVWGVRGANSAREGHDWLGSLLVKAETRLSKRPAAIIANSTPAIANCRSLGWPAANLYLVPNGLDPDAFRFDATGRESLRATWRVEPGQQVIGVAGRLDPVKGLEVLMTAVRDLSKGLPGLRVVVAGDGSSGYAASLRSLVCQLGIECRVTWLGSIRDMAGFYSAVDLLCLPSLSEGCSNVIAEAMACGTLVVATRVGDNAEYLRDASCLAVPDSAGDLARAILHGLHSSGDIGREEARLGILERLALAVMVQRTESRLLTAVVPRDPARKG